MLLKVGLMSCIAASTDRKNNVPFIQTVVCFQSVPFKGHQRGWSASENDLVLVFGPTCHKR